MSGSKAANAAVRLGLLVSLLTSCGTATAESPTQTRPAVPTAPASSTPTATRAPTTAPLQCAPGFGNGGISTTSIEGGYEAAVAAALLPDGKILTTGAAQNVASMDVLLIRYNADGSLDGSFGQDGKVTTQLPGDFAEGNVIAVQADGKLLVAGTAWKDSDPDLVLLRYNADGALDESFGVSGTVTMPVGLESYSTAILLQPDGKIIVGGYTLDGLDADPNGVDFFLLRFDENGRLDPTFNGDGMVITDIAGDDDVLSGLALQPDGKIVAAGSSNSNDPQPTDPLDRVATRIALARLDGNGNLDSTFGGDGIVTTSTGYGGHSDEAFAVAIQSDGKIVIAGRSRISGLDVLLARYDADGSLDTSLAGEGFVTTPLGPVDAQAEAIAIQADGKIVVAGWALLSDVDYIENFALVRYHIDGSLDTGFSGEGWVITPISTRRNLARAVLVQPDGKILAIGGHGGDIALVRYRTDGTLDDGSCEPR